MKVSNVTHIPFLFYFYKRVCGARPAFLSPSLISSFVSLSRQEQRSVSASKETRNYTSGSRLCWSSLSLSPEDKHEEHAKAQPRQPQQQQHENMYIEKNLSNKISLTNIATTPREFVHIKNLSSLLFSSLSLSLSVSVSLCLSVSLSLSLSLERERDSPSSCCWLYLRLPLCLYPTLECQSNYQATEGPRITHRDGTPNKQEEQNCCETKTLSLSPTLREYVHIKRKKYLSQGTRRTEPSTSKRHM